VTFLHTHTAGTLVSRCTLCGHTIASRDERDVYLGQRAHTAVACITWRLLADAPRLTDEWTEPEPDRCPEGHERAGNTCVDGRGHLVCNACRREDYAATRQERAS